MKSKPLISRSSLPVSALAASLLTIPCLALLNVCLSGYQQLFTGLTQDRFPSGEALLQWIIVQ